MSERKRIVIVGSGIAGLITAIQLAENHNVTLVTKLEIAESNTRWAQGGIAAAMFPDDSVAEHVADTLRAGAGLCSRAAVEVLCSEGPERIRDLMRLGVDFDMSNGELARGLEAAHSRSRVLHAGGDSTGLSIELALVRAVRSSGVRVMEHTFACDLMLESERVVGLKLLDAEGEFIHLDADAVILASGGAGQLYRHTTNPACATGDGVAMALRAGAVIADVEFYQFHPTALATPDTFLISEAVRGEGAVLLDINGRRFMQSLHNDAELASRDIVARGIAMQMSAQGGAPVLLDVTKFSADFLASRFPKIDAACRARGFDWAKEPIPVSPAAHYWMGGVMTDLWGRTSIRGLFAVGEVACTGVHGANRLASNSLLESLVFAWRCARRVGECGWLQDYIWPSFGGQDMGSPVDIGSSNDRTVGRTELQQLMWDFVGIERNGPELRAAVKMLNGWVVDGSTIASLETRNLLDLARAMTTAAEARRESRGAHFRSDFPNTSAAWQRSLRFEWRIPVAAQ